ncbi:MAG: N-acetyltransferase [Candidatus Micrarchaeota archaeon]|nr:N-acetyltransferase [Candidatus Micrarchaeota archaeon]
MEIKHKDGRFSVKTEHGEAELLYKDIGNGVISAYHTFTPEEDRGQGVAERLALAVFEYAKEKGLKVRPDCPYLPRFLEKHREWKPFSTG